MKRSHALAASALAVAALAVIYACSNDDTSNPATTGQDGGSQIDATPLPPVDSGNPLPKNDANPPPPDGGPGDCFQGTPSTYLEIINACTDAQAVDKTVDLSKMNLADGGLKPLQ